MKPPPADPNGGRQVIRHGIAEEWARQDARRLQRHKARMATYASYGPMRRKLVQVIESRTFEIGVYVVLVLNCLLLGVQNIRSLQPYQAASETLDGIFTLFYVIEMSLKIAALGVGIKGGYLSRYWNWIDGSLALASAVAILVDLSGASSASTLPTVVRALQLIRPLRMLTALSSLRVLLRALGASVKRLGNVAVLTAAFLALMALIALAFFRFTFDHQCQTVTYLGFNSTSKLSAVGLVQDDEAPVCVVSGNVSDVWWWAANATQLPQLDPVDVAAIRSTLGNASATVIPPSALSAVYNGVVCPFGEYCLRGVGPDNGFSSFDSIFSSTVLLYTILSLEGWSSIMFFVMDALGQWVSLYFVVNVMVGTIFVLNLVLATVSDGFGRSIKYQKRFSSKRSVAAGGEGGSGGNGAAPIAPSWGGMFIPAGLSLLALPDRTIADSLHKASEKVRLYLLYNRVYQLIRPVATSISVVILATTYSGMSEAHKQTIASATMVFTIVFAVENVLECIGLRSRFFWDPLRVADAMVSIGAIVELSLDAAPTISSLRLLRLTEVLMRFPALRRQIRILKFAIQDTLPLLLFMGILLFLGALVGTQLFAGRFCGLDTTTPSRVDTSLCDDVPRLNFDNIGYSVVSVFVIFCGDGWRSMMVLGMQVLGDYAALYYCLCYLLGGYLMLNLFVAVMITSADMLEDEPEQTIVRSERVSLFDPVSVASGTFAASSRRTTLKGMETSDGGAPQEEEHPRDEEEMELVREASMEVAFSNDSLARPSRQTSDALFDDAHNDSFILGSGAKSQRARMAAMQRASSSSDAGGLKRQQAPPTTATVQQQGPGEGVSGTGRLMPLMTSLSGIADDDEITERSIKVRSRSVRFEDDEKLDALLSPRSPAATQRPPSPKDDVDSDDDDPLKLSIGLLTLVDSIRANNDRGRSSSPMGGTDERGGVSMSDSTAQRVLDDEAEYDVINRHADVGDVASLRRAYRDVYNREIEQLPWFRRVAGSIVKSRRFEHLYTVIVIYSMVTVAIGRTTDYPDSSVVQFKEWSDLVVALLFVAESALKGMHYGLFHKKGTLLKGYFNYRWNIFDGVIMILSTVVACAIFSQDRTFRLVASWFRIARVFRPFSLIGRHEGLKVVARASLASVPYIRNVGLLTILAWVSFAIFGTQLFAGRFSACTQDSWGDATYGVVDNITTRDACIANNYTWTPADRNFDNLGSSLLTLFQVATVDNWSDIMFMGADSREVNVAPEQRARMYLIPFFVGFILLTNFFLIQFFVASMCDVYFTVKAQMEEALRNRLLQSHAIFLDPQQKAFLSMYRRALYFVKPPLHVRIEDGSIRSYMRRIVRHHTFEPLFTVLAIAHISIESLVFAESPPFSLDTLLIIDWGFTFVFCLVAACTWFVYGTRNFFDSSRGRGSIFINILTLTGLILETTDANAGAASLLRQMRVFRLYRIFYVTQTMQLLVDTLVYSLPSFANVFFLLFLVFYVYAAIGMQLFGRVQFSDERTGIGRYANFDRFDKALIALLRVATFDDWTELMYSCAVQSPTCSEQLGNCGPHPLVAYVYFLSFAVIGQWIGINFFAAEIIDAFTHAEMEERYAIQKEHVARFQRLWKEIVGSGEGHMTVGQLSIFLRRLGPPLGPVLGKPAQDAADDENESNPLLAIQTLAASFSEPYSPAGGGTRPSTWQGKAPAANGTFGEVFRFMASLELPMVHNGVLQGSVFDALMRRFYAVPLPPKYEQSLGRVLNARFQTRQFIRMAASTQSDADLRALHAAVDFSSPLSVRSGVYSPEEQRQDPQHPFWMAYRSEQKRSARHPGQVAYTSGGENIRMAVAAVILQKRWRGARIRELVRMSRGGGTSSYTVPSPSGGGKLVPVKSFARYQPGQVGYIPPSTPLRERHREDSPRQTLARSTGSSPSANTYDKPKKFVSIVDRLKASHSELI